MDDFGAWPSLQSLLSEVCQHRRVTLAAWHGHRATQAPQNSCVPSATSFRLIWCYCFIDRRDIWHCFLGPLTSYPYSKIHEHCIYNYPSYIVELTLRSGRWYRSYCYSRPDDYDSPSDVHRTKCDDFITLGEQRRSGTRKHQSRKFFTLGPREEKVTTKGNVSFALVPISRFQVQRRRRLKSGAFVESRGSIFRS